MHRFVLTVIWNANLLPMNFQAAKERRKVDHLNIELGALKHKQDLNNELEKKIAELENKLEKAKSSKKASLANI